MSKKPLVRNGVTVCFGTVLLGLGCTQRQPDKPQEKPRLPDRQSGKTAANDRAEIPTPQFGLPVSEVLESEPAEAESAAPPERKLRDTLLASTSDTTLAAAVQDTAPVVAAYENAIILEAEDNIPSPLVEPEPEPTIPAPARNVTTDEETGSELSVEPAPEPAPKPAPILAEDAAAPEIDTPSEEPIRAVPARRSIPARAVEILEDDVVADEVEEIASESDEEIEEEIAKEVAEKIISVVDDSASESQTQISSRPAQVPTFASLVPPPRSPAPMVSTQPQRPVSTELEPANDDDDISGGFDERLGPAPQAKTRSTTQSSAQTAALIPPARTASTLGLGPPQTSNPEPAAQSLASQDGAGPFTASAQPPVLSYQDELILEVKIEGINASDTVIAYGTREGVYLPLGTLARILDLAITVSDDGHYANGWFLSEDRTLTVDLRQGLLTRSGKVQKLDPAIAAAFDGELYLRSDRFSEFLPLKLNADLRRQAVFLETLEPFPFEERMQREADRRKLESRGATRAESRFPREETPWLALSVPVADLELRALSDSAFGPRVEGDLLLAGDLGFLTAEAYASATTRDGLIASLIEVGRTDPDADLLGPLQATSFSVGDISSVSLPIGLRGVAGRGFTVTNSPQESVSVFEKIDLRGILPDGFEVELYRNDILVGSTRQSVNGQYEFQQVPVDFGLNIFRLVFFGPQGQRSEQVRRIRVGDGRLAAGKLVYRFGAVEKGENVLGVRAPRFSPSQDFGSLRATAEIAYGLSSDLTTVLSGAWFESDRGQHWTASAGVRTSLGGFAIKGDVAAADGNAFAFSSGIGGRIGGSAITLSHVEYSGEFIDETRSTGNEFLRRSTELDFNTTLELGNPITGLVIPLTARIRHVETADGRLQTNAGLRSSTRVAGLLASNTLEYTRTSLPQAEAFSQLFGNFDLATVGRSRVRGRLSLGYQVLPDPDILNASAEVDYAIDQDTAIRGSVGYSFQSKSAQVGLSAVRDFDRFSLGVDGNYSFADQAYSVGLRLGFSFGRDPVRGNFFFARSGLANSGGASVRAFRDMDGDGVFGAGDSVLPEVEFAAFNQTVTTGEDGVARLGGLGEGRGVSVQVDTSSLPDIDLAPAKPGIEIVPRPGRIHTSDFPIVALSEVEGTLSFNQDGESKGVSGVRLQLHDRMDKPVSFAKTEIDGYFFFERVMPGRYTVKLEPGQAKRLNLCASEVNEVTVGFKADIIKSDVAIGVCGANKESAQ